VLVADRSESFAGFAERALGHERGVAVVAVPSAGLDDQRVTFDVVLIDAERARGFLAARPTHPSGQRFPRVIVLADDADAPHAAELVRMGAVGLVYRNESITALVETIHAVLRGEARLPQPLLDELLDRNDRATGPAVSEPPVEALLTRREMEILRLLEQGISRAEIAGYLNLSPNTVRSHVQRILNRLGVHSTLAAVARVRSERMSTSAQVGVAGSDGQVLGEVR